MFIKQNKTRKIPGKMYYGEESYNTLSKVSSKVFTFCQIRMSLNVNFNNWIFIDTTYEPISEKKILYVVSKLKNKFTSGPYKIPSFILRDCIRTFIFLTLTFPDSWKVAKCVLSISLKILMSSIAIGRYRFSIIKKRS